MDGVTTERHADPIVPWRSRTGGTECHGSTEPWELDVAREMLSTMDTLTRAGQLYVMQKIVGLIDDQLARHRATLGRRNHGMLAEHVGYLARASRQVCPDAQLFVHHAEGLVDLLAAAT